MKKVAVITGASSGIGSELAQLYLKKNYILILSGRNKEGFSLFKNKPNVEIIIGDITKPQTRREIVNLVYKKYKQLDVLINNAGISCIQPFEENTEEQLNSLIETNLKAPILLTHQLYEIMKSQKNGTVVFMNSSAGRQGYPNHSLYSTTKFGLSGFSQSLRLEAKKYGVRILSVYPGGVKTHLYDKVSLKPDTNLYMDPKKLAEIVVYLTETSDLSPDEIVVNRMTK